MSSSRCVAAGAGCSDQNEPMCQLLLVNRAMGTSRWLNDDIPLNVSTVQHSVPHLSPSRRMAGGTVWLQGRSCSYAGLRGPVERAQAAGAAVCGGGRRQPAADAARLGPPGRSRCRRRWLSSNAFCQSLNILAALTRPARDAAERRIHTRLPRRQEMAAAPAAMWCAAWRRRWRRSGKQRKQRPWGGRSSGGSGRRSRRTCWTRCCPPPPPAPGRMTQTVVHNRTLLTPGWAPDCHSRRAARLCCVSG